LRVPAEKASPKVVYFRYIVRIPRYHGFTGMHRLCLFSFRTRTVYVYLALIVFKTNSLEFNYCNTAAKKLILKSKFLGIGIAQFC